MTNGVFSGIAAAPAAMSWGLSSVSCMMCSFSLAMVFVKICSNYGWYFESAVFQWSFKASAVSRGACSGNQ